MANKRYDSSRREGETPLQHYRRLAKVADQRLVRLEKLSGEKGFKNVLKWSYRYAQREINYYQGVNRKIPTTHRQLLYMEKAGKTPGRFNTKPPMTVDGKIDYNKLEGKIARMQEFLDRPTSAKGAIVEVYEKRAKTLNQRYNMDMKWSELADFFESDAYKRYSNKSDGIYDSATILTFKRSLERVDDDVKDAIEDTLSDMENASEEEIVKAIKENSDIHFQVIDENGKEDEVAKNFIYKELAKNGLDIFDLTE